VAMYDRARDSLAIIEDRPLTDDSKVLAKLLRRYNVGLTR
jgi:hypothetical protein